MPASRRQPGACGSEGRERRLKPAAEVRRRAESPCRPVSRCAAGTACVNAMLVVCGRSGTLPSATPMSCTSRPCRRRKRIVRRSAKLIVTTGAPTTCSFSASRCGPILWPSLPSYQLTSDPLSRASTRALLQSREPTTEALARPAARRPRAGNPGRRPATSAVRRQGARTSAADGSRPGATPGTPRTVQA